MAATWAAETISQRPDSAVDGDPGL